MGTPVAANIDSVSAVATNTAATAADQIDGLTDATFTESMDVVETNYLGGGAYKKRAATLKDTALDLTYQEISGDAPQALLASSYASGATVFMTIKYDPNAASGKVIGKQVPMIVTSLDKKLNAANVVECTAKLVGNGAPTDVTTV